MFLAICFVFRLFLASLRFRWTLMHYRTLVVEHWMGRGLGSIWMTPLSEREKGRREGEGKAHHGSEPTHPQPKKYKLPLVKGWREENLVKVAALGVNDMTLFLRNNRVNFTDTPGTDGSPSGIRLLTSIALATASLCLPQPCLNPLCLWVWESV